MKHASRNHLRWTRLTTLGLAAALGIAAVATAQTPQAPADQTSDPALANMVPDTPAGAYPQQAPAPIVRSQPNPDANAGDSSGSADGAAADDGSQNQAADGAQAPNSASTTADQPPPAIPDYDQPDAPGDDYLWTPGYWGYATIGYYWVPGAWIVPPFYGGLWTPGYWAATGGLYGWNPGYWGTHVGFYGGVNYGFGYIGTGYFGGYWRGNAFLYNRAVTSIGPTVSTTNIYNHAVVYNGRTYGPRPGRGASYNGGRNGIALAPRPNELAAMHERHTAALPGQLRLNRMAAANPLAAFNANRGHPPLAAQREPMGVGSPIAVSQTAFQSRQQLLRSQQQRPGRPQPYRPQPAARQADVPHVGK